MSIDPFDELWILNQAHALQQLNHTEEAYSLLLVWVTKFMREENKWLCHCRLATYACQLGQLDAAIKSLRKAIDLAGKENVRSIAL